MRTVAHWIDGARVEGRSTRRGVVTNPATGEQLGEVVLADASDVDVAVRAASAAAEVWAESSTSERARILFRFRELMVSNVDELAALITMEHGKTIPDSVGEIERAIEVVEWCCAVPSILQGSFSSQVAKSVDVSSLRQPLGVVAGVTPFNFPVMVPMWMHAVAIASGNAFVLKASERDPSPSNFVAQLWSEAGLPDGVFNVVHGDGATVDALIDHPDIAGVSFVGSTPVARYVHERCSLTGKRVQALGGAKNHAIVMPDGDLDFAATQLCNAAFGSAGQRCMALSVAVAIDGAGDDLRERVRSIAATLRVGPGNDRETDMGPVISAASKDRILSLVGSGESEGAEVALDGRPIRVEGFEHGYFVGPTVLDHVQQEMEVYREEIFGPVLSIVRVTTLDDAIDLINRGRFGNGAAIFTSSGTAAREFSRRARVGMIGVNVPVPVPVPQFSFGGWNDSLFGSHHIYGADGVNFYTRGKVVTSRWSADTAQRSLAMPTTR